jgi:hypothetical protein
MKPRLLTILLSLAAIATLAGAVAPAAGATRTVKVPAATYESASLKGSNGFKIELLLGPGFTDVVGTKRLGNNAFETTSYSLRSGKIVKGGALDVRVGNYAKFQGRFVSKSTEKQPSGCKGGLAVLEKGFFVGSFRFRGTGGFTRADARRAPGMITRQPADVCREPSPPKSGREQKSGSTKEEATEVNLRATNRSGDVTFAAQQTVEPLVEDSATEPVFTASATRHAGRVTISSLVFSFFGAKPSAFEFPEPRTEATVTPPAPFSGTATYVSEGPKKSSWTGDLSVEPPGFGRVPLAGKKFTATIEEEAVDNSDDGSFYFGREATTKPR